MKRPRLILAVAIAAMVLPCMLAPVPAAAAVRSFSALAIPVVDLAPAANDGEWLAQRVIEREWGLSDDSTYRDVEVPGWKSEGVALAMSAGLPGAGQLYAGAGSGWAFLAAELLGWAGRTFANSEASSSARDAQAFVGDPYDTTSGWSFARYEQYGGGNAGDLEELWRVDREAYYQTLRNDPEYLAGFSGNQPEETQRSYRDMRAKRDQNLRRAHLAESILWVNHVVAAVDAVRAARLNNLPLRQEYQLQLGQRMREGNREWRATLLRRF